KTWGVLNPCTNERFLYCPVHGAFSHLGRSRDAPAIRSVFSLIHIEHRLRRWQAPIVQASLARLTSPGGLRKMLETRGDRRAPDGEPARAGLSPRDRTG